MIIVVAGLFGFKFLASDSEARDAVQDVCIELHRTVLVYDSCSPYTVSICMFWSTASRHSISAPTRDLDGEGYHRFSDGLAVPLLTKECSSIAHGAP